MARSRAAAKKPPRTKAKKTVTARRKKAGRRVELRVAVRARREVVWDAVATSRGLVSWYARDAEIDPVVGGAYRCAWGDAAQVGLVLEVERGRRIDLGWHHGTRVTIRLARRHGGRETVVTLGHAGISAAVGNVELYAQLRQSWTFSLVNLKSVLERGVDLRERDRRRTFARAWVNCWD